MHPAPDYTYYNLTQLHEALQGLDHVQYPERAQRIRDEIELRQKAGVLLSVEDGRAQFWAPHISWRYVALPIWWTMFWRSALANVLFSLVVFLLFRILATVLGSTTQAAAQGVLLIQFLSIPGFGVFFMKQALAKHYNSFRILIQERDI